MTLNRILSKYPDLQGKIRDTEDANIKLLTENNEYKLYIVLNSDKPFQLKERETSISCENLEDISNYISELYPLRKGDVVSGMGWLGNKIEILAENSKAFVFVDEKGKYGVAYNSFYVGRSAFMKDISLEFALKIARDDFGLFCNDYLYTENKNIYDLIDSQHDYLIVRNISDDNYLCILKTGFEKENNYVSWTCSEKFDTLEKAQAYAWKLYDMDYTIKCEMLREKIQREYIEIRSRIKEMSTDEVLTKINQIHAIESVKKVFDGESGVFIPKAAVEYLLNENISAIEEVSMKIADGDSMEFHVENVNAAVDEIQYEMENKKLQIQSQELEMELY